ncbi:hypothetical protein EVC11_007 [Rhizobium phage RHph_I20]|uniref:Uncharacterized protein n=1 Tax=Rhizobium phage RHph_I20 TaxID=2509730 RepID=A0A7S5UZ44_9CAUD|nr:hypothetical protein EVC11_007 [Rhizobium phage RHph_I20]
MAISRDVGGLQPMQVRAAQQTAEVQYSGPSDQSDVRALISGLSGLSEGVSRLGYTMAQNERRKKEDPEMRRMAYARAGLEVAAAGNDPDAGVKLYAGADADSNPHYKQGVAMATAGAYFDRMKDQLLQEASAQGANNVDWNKRGAELISEGKKKGYLPDDYAAGAFLDRYNGFLDQIRTQGTAQKNANNEFGKLNSLQVQTQNDFVKALETGGPAKAQDVLNKLYSSPEFNSVQPPQREKMVEATIQGIVATGNTTAFTALTSIDGPDGIPLQTKYAGSWEVWKKQVEENALKIKDGEIADATMAGQGDYAKSLAIANDRSQGFVAQTTGRVQAAQALAMDTLREVSSAVTSDGVQNVDIQQYRAKALDKLKADGLANDPRAVEAFSKSFDSQVQSYLNTQQDSRNKDARLQADTQTLKALTARFTTTLNNAGADAAVSDLQSALTENKVFQGRSLVEQGQMVAQIAQQYAADGNIKALTALGNIKVDNKGSLLSDQMGVEFDRLQATAAEAARSSFKARIEPIKEKIRTKALLGLLTDDDTKEGIAAGVPTDWLAEQEAKRDEVLQSKANEAFKTREKTAKAEQLDRQSSGAAKALMSGRGDLILDNTINPDPRDPTKTSTLTRDEIINAGMEEVEKDISTRYDIANPNADADKRRLDIHRQLMQVYSRNGLIDDNSKNLVKTFLGKAQSDGFSIGPEDEGQLKELRDIVTIYSPAQVDELVGGGKRREFFDAVMAKLDEGADPGAAIAYGRTLRDAPDDQKVLNINKQDLDTAVANVRSELSGFFESDTDPFLNNVIEQTVKDKLKVGSTSDYAQKEAIRDIQSRYVLVNGRHVNFVQFAGAKSPDQVREVLQDAAEQYQKAHASELANSRVVFDNGPRPGTVRLYYADTGLPVTHKLINWNDIVTDWQKRVGPKREADKVDTAKRAAKATQDALDADRRWEKQVTNPDAPQ